MFGHYKVISLHKVWLVSKKNVPWAKDSVDFLAFILNDAGNVELWAVEIKSRQTVETVSKERELLRKLRRKKYELIDDANKALNHIPNHDERYQIFDHAYVYGVDKVALIVGERNGGVISGTVVNFDWDLQDCYGNVVDEIKKIALEWAYDESTKVIPENIVTLSDEIATINEKEALYGSFKLWRCMFFSDPSVLPRTTLKRIIPTTHAKWNATKGGSDTITKIVDDCYVHPPRIYTNFETSAKKRFFQIPNNGALP